MQATDCHDPLTETHGALPAFDQPAPRAHRIAPAPQQRPSLSRRLETLLARLNAWHLRRLQASLRNQLDDLQASIDQATELAIAMARANRYSPWLQGQRRAMREQRELLADRLREVARELSQVGAAS